MRTLKLEYWQEKDWKWFGHAAHLCVGHDCRFHMATQVGPWLVSTVGEYWGSRSVREIHAIGCGRKYETMVFRAGAPCDSTECGCGLPEIDGSEEDCDCYNDVKSATEGHIAMCKKWAALNEQVKEDE